MNGNLTGWRRLSGDTGLRVKFIFLCFSFLMCTALLSKTEREEFGVSCVCIYIYTSKDDVIVVIQSLQSFNLGQHIVHPFLDLSAFFAWCWHQKTLSSVCKARIDEHPSRPRGQRVCSGACDSWVPFTCEGVVEDPDGVYICQCMEYTYIYKFRYICLHKCWLG